MCDECDTVSKIIVTFFSNLKNNKKKISPTILSPHSDNDTDKEEVSPVEEHTLEKSSTEPVQSKKKQKKAHVVHFNLRVDEIQSSPASKFY